MTMPLPPLLGFARDVRELGRKARAEAGARDVVMLKRMKWLSRAAEVAGRLSLHFFPLLGVFGPVGWVAGVIGLAFHLSVEAQLNHSIMHGAFVGLPGAGRFTPGRYETLALPFRSKTWRDAHRIHHVSPSLLGMDPDTIHPLFRMHATQKWRPWHLLNTWIGAVFTFECWAFDYDRFLKHAGLRPQGDRGELRKVTLHVGYQYVLFPLLAGAHWKEVLAAGVIAAILRNLVFTGLQTGSSVGHAVSTVHCQSFERKRGDAWFRFQVETSKNFVLRGAWRLLCGGLDRHIEHHMFPNLPPTRLHLLSEEVRALCERHGVRYIEYPSVWASLDDSLSYLRSLSVRRDA